MALIKRVKEPKFLAIDDTSYEVGNTVLQLGVKVKRVIIEKDTQILAYLRGGLGVKFKRLLFTEDRFVKSGCGTKKKQSIEIDSVYLCKNELNCEINETIIEHRGIYQIELVGCLKDDEVVNLEFLKGGYGRFRGIDDGSSE